MNNMISNAIKFMIFNDKRLCNSMGYMCVYVCFCVFLILRKRKKIHVYKFWKKSLKYCSLSFGSWIISDFYFLLHLFYEKDSITFIKYIIMLKF